MQAIARSIASDASAADGRRPKTFGSTRSTTAYERPRRTERILSHCDEALANAIDELSPWNSHPQPAGHRQFKHREMAATFGGPDGMIMSAFVSAGTIVIGLAEHAHEQVARPRLLQTRSSSLKPAAI
jgi:hypothetical protein